MLASGEVVASRVRTCRDQSYWEARADAIGDEVGAYIREVFARRLPTVELPAPVTIRSGVGGEASRKLQDTVGRFTRRRAVLFAMPAANDQSRLTGQEPRT